MSLTVIFAIILIHWFGDFVLQTDEQAKKKSTDWRYLIRHTFNYSFTWFLIGTIWSIVSNIYTSIYTNNTYLFSWWFVWVFSFITFITHTITDYFTSRLNSKLWAKGDVHNFFVSIGFDQVLHYVQLFLTYQLCVQIFS